MEITVSLTVELGATADFDAVEPQIVAEGRRAMVQAVRAVCREYEGRTGSCPHCQSPLLQSEGTDRRVLLCHFGRVEVMLRRLRCEGCGAHFRPADAFLACLQGGNLSRTLREACVLAGTSWPYRTAARVLHELCGARVSAETVRQVARRVGEGAVAEETAAAREALTPPQRADAPPEATPAPDQLLVGLDGGWVPSRDQRGGMEGKVGVLATEVEAIGHGRHRLSRRRYVATFQGAARVGELAYAAARDLDGDRAHEQVALGDGADWIKRQVDLHFPDAVRILDWPHLERCVRRAIRAARPGTTGREERHELYGSVFAALGRGDSTTAADSLRALRPPDAAEPIEALEAALTYLCHQRDWIGDYSAWKDNGYPIGSGLAERAVEIVINRRMKRRGMRWLRANADPLVALRVRTLNRDWDDATSRRAA
jgi:hypothetical protein